MTNPAFARTKQCAKCPWRQSTTPSTIPGQYDAKKHANLAACNGETGKLMACHESSANQPYACVGWMVNQLEDNNIPLRLRAMRGAFDTQALIVDGEQHHSLAAMCASAKRK